MRIKRLAGMNSTMSAEYMAFADVLTGMTHAYCYSLGSEMPKME